MKLLSVAVLCSALGTPALAIEGGTPTTAFNAVGVGVQVTDDWVLAVAHATLSVGSTYFNGYGGRTVLANYHFPGGGLGEFPANDMSLLRLAPAATSVPRLQVSSDLYSDGTFPPLAVTVSSTVNSGPARGYGFTTVSEFNTLFDPDDSGPLEPVVANYLLSYDSGVYVQNGDSGGGLFLGHVTDATSPLLALSSAQLTDENQVPTGSAFVLLAAYRGWIDQTMVGDLTDNQTVHWVSTVPEPATLVLWALGFATLIPLSARRCRA